MDNIDSEIIFFEQYYRLLKVGGIAEVVIPDGILTNSSSQYVRDFISERFRILAIISLPQYAFSHYGAGVKSSIVILKKHDPSVSKRIKSAKLKYLTIAVKAHNADLNRLEGEKKTFAVHYPQLQELVSKQNDDVNSIKKQLSSKPTELKKQLAENKRFYSEKIKEIQQLQSFKDWKKAKDDELNNQIRAIKDHIQELATFDFKKFEKEFDYPIFMAIADHIGYDATGRETNQNDLAAITPELCRFLQAVENRTDPFFALALPQ
jgi:type I restriction enzyme M protein